MPSARRTRSEPDYHHPALPSAASTIFSPAPKIAPLERPRPSADSAFPPMVLRACKQRNLRSAAPHNPPHSGLNGVEERRENRDCLSQDSAKVAPQRRTSFERHSKTKRKNSIFRKFAASWPPAGTSQRTESLFSAIRRRLLAAGPVVRHPVEESPPTLDESAESRLTDAKMIQDLRCAPTLIEDPRVRPSHSPPPRVPPPSHFGPDDQLAPARKRYPRDARCR